MSSGEAPLEEAPVRDELREALLERVLAELGDAVAATHLKPGADLWVRVHTDEWAPAGQVLRAVAANHQITGEARTAYVDAASRLGNFEEGRALSALVKAEKPK